MGCGMGVVICYMAIVSGCSVLDITGVYKFLFPEKNTPTNWTSKEATTHAITQLLNYCVPAPMLIPSSDFMPAHDASPYYQRSLLSACLRAKHIPKPSLASSISGTNLLIPMWHQLLSHVKPPPTNGAIHVHCSIMRCCLVVN
jgi:hypothetical protein